MKNNVIKKYVVNVLTERGHCKSTCDPNQRRNFQEKSVSWRRFRQLGTKRRVSSFIFLNTCSFLLTLSEKAFVITSFYNLFRRYFMFPCGFKRIITFIIEITGRLIRPKVDIILFQTRTCLGITHFLKLIS